MNSWLQWIIDNYILFSLIKYIVILLIVFYFFNYKIREKTNLFFKIPIIFIVKIFWRILKK
jgi:hypothetical protein